MKPVTIYSICVLSSILVSIPLVLTFRLILEYLIKIKLFRKIAIKINFILKNKIKKLKSTSILGLILFVGVPIPTTGTWSASAIASILRMRLRDAVLGIFLGNVISGIIVLYIPMQLF